MTSVTIRPADPADAEGIARVHVSTWRHAYTGIVPDDVLAGLDVDRRAARTRVTLGRPGPFTTVVAVDSTGVAGFVTYGPFRTGRRDDGTEILDDTAGELLAIYVDPDRQGAGIGHDLMDAAVDGLAAAGYPAMLLWVLEENAPSRRFYERYGLAWDGTRHTYQVDAAAGPVDLPELRYALRIGKEEQ